MDDDDNMVEEVETGNSAIDVQISNLFYEAEDCIRSDPRTSLAKFQQLIELVQCNKSIHTVLNELSSDSRQSFVQAMTHIVVLHYKLQEYQPMIQQYKLLLSYVPYMSRAESTDTVNTVLNTVPTTAAADITFLSEIYTLTSSTLSKINDTQRIIFGIDVKLCKLYVDTKQYKLAYDTLNNLHRSCMIVNESGVLVDDRVDKASELLEIYAIEIRISFAQHNVSAMRSLYEATKDLSAAVKGM